MRIRFLEIWSFAITRYSMNFLTPPFWMHQVIIISRALISSLKTGAGPLAWKILKSHSNRTYSNKITQHRPFWHASTLPYLMMPQLWACSLTTTNLYCKSSSYNNQKTIPLLKRPCWVSARKHLAVQRNLRKCSEREFSNLRIRMQLSS